MRGQQLRVARNRGLQSIVISFACADERDYVCSTEFPDSPVRQFSPMFKLLRKFSEVRPRAEQSTALAEELARRVSAIEFRPSKGFLKDQQQPKRSAGRTALGVSSSDCQVLRRGPADLMV
jgi:hypothetical protein